MKKLKLARLLFIVIIPSAALFAQKPDTMFANTGSAAAQSAFLRALAQLHNFEYETAAEDFRQAQAIDPDFAMAYWGEAMTYNHPVWYQQNRKAAQTVLQRLGATEEARLGKCGTERERDYIRAVDTLYFSEGSKYERDFKYADAMASLYAKYPNDVDAGAFYSLAILGTSHYGRDFAVYMRALAILEPLFAAHPNHPGVNHYLIHSVDDPIHAPLGLAAARNYSKIALNAPHAQHMTSHIFVAMGMWDDVVEANLAALRVQNERMRQGEDPEVCGHYPSWLEYGYLQEGRIQDARKVLEKCRDAALHADAAKPDGLGLIAFYADMRSRFLLDSEDWNGEVAHWTVPPTDDPNVQITVAFIDGFAAIRRADVKTAKEALKLMEANDKAKNFPPGPDGTLVTPDSRRVAILHQEMEAIIDASEGDKDKAIALLREATAKEVVMPVEFGPPFIEKPTNELLGEVLLEAGHPKEAQVAFESSLSGAPKRTQSLMGLLRVQKATGDLKGAAQMTATLRQIWHNADHIPAEISVKN